MAQDLGQQAGGPGPDGDLAGGLRSLHVGRHPAHHQGLQRRLGFSEVRNFGFGPREKGGEFWWKMGGFPWCWVFRLVSQKGNGASKQKPKELKCGMVDFTGLGARTRFGVARDGAFHSSSFLVLF